MEFLFAQVKRQEAFFAPKISSDQRFFILVFSLTFPGISTCCLDACRAPILM